MTIFESLPAFFSVYIPLAALVFLSILFEDKLIRVEQRLFQKMRAKRRRRKYERN